ncbi:retron system putative HNH endonuclease [uncultured Desulfovibrio sp.]|uniref:retron system putative HNH endonuclease n=1 Tax=uncultured Desulfovibrio sp. TaxID=167968 RepID=UPI00262F8895|nr:retron system putative HNH endonuclease [uncultured Desulfovibrio sp.]
MIFIKKSNEPPRLTDWKKRFPNGKYEDLSTCVRIELRNSLLVEQGFVCCFCGAAIGKKGTGTIIQQTLLKKGQQHNIRNAHLTPQSKDPLNTLSYENICASCASTDGERHCDIAQGDQSLPISPLEEDCLSFFSFSVDGKILPNFENTPENQKKASDTIELLGLQAKTLNVERKKILEITENLLKIDPDCLINLEKKDSNGRYAPYYFVPLSFYKNN